MEIEFQVKHSQVNRLAVRFALTGKVGSIAISGHTQTVFIGLDVLSLSLAADVLTMNRAEGGHAPFATRREVEKALLSKLIEIEKMLISS